MKKDSSKKLKYLNITIDLEAAIYCLNCKGTARFGVKMDINTLITLVFSKPPIWDKRDKKHSNRQTVDRCWKEISAEMSVDDHKLRKKWKYLRDQFAAELAKIYASLSEDEPSVSYETRWPHYNSLLFLKDVIKVRNPLRKSKSLNRASSLSNTSEDDEELEVKRKRFSRPKAKKVEDDEHTLFLKSLLPHIRKIPPERLLSFRNDIQRTVDIYAYQCEFPENSP